MSGRKKDGLLKVEGSSCIENTGIPAEQLRSGRKWSTGGSMFRAAFGDFLAGGSGPQDMVEVNVEIRWDNYVSGFELTPAW